jgi:hypothetical protein
MTAKGFGLGLVLFLGAGLSATAERFLLVSADYAPLYAQPSDSLPPLQMARKGDRFPVRASASDDSGVIWFCVGLKEGGPDTAWIPFTNVRYLPAATDSLRSVLSLKTTDRNDQKRRYAALRTHPEWPRRVRNAVRNGEIVLDMSLDQVKGSWGEPVRRGRAFLAGIGNFEILHYSSKRGQGLAEVMLQENRVVGWSEE